MIKGASDGSQRTTVTELTKRLQLEQHTVTELVSRAAGAGLIRRQRSPSDGRVTHLSLSAKGEARLAASFRDLDVERLALAAAISKLGGRRPRSR